MPDATIHGPMFRKRDNDAIVKVESVTSGYAQITVMSRLPTSWSMPIAQYDSTFVRDYEPIPGTGALAAGDKFREPVNSDLWDTPERGLQIAPDAPRTPAPTGEAMRPIPETVPEPPAPVTVGGPAPWETTEGLNPIVP